MGTGGGINGCVYQPARSLGSGTRDFTQMPHQHTATHHSPDLSHVITPRCKAVWGGENAPDRTRVLMERRTENRHGGISSPDRPDIQPVQPLSPPFQPLFSLLRLPTPSHLQIRFSSGRSLVVITNIQTWPSWLALIFLQKIPVFPESKHLEDPNTQNTLPFTGHSSCHIILLDFSDMLRTCPQVLES